MLLVSPFAANNIKLMFFDFFLTKMPYHALLHLDEGVPFILYY